MKLDRQKSFTSLKKTCAFLTYIITFSHFFNICFFQSFIEGLVISWTVTVSQMCFCNGCAWIVMRQREKGRGCITYFECSESFSKIDTKQTVWHMYLPTEWELDAHKSTSKGVIEGVCSTRDEGNSASHFRCELLSSSAHIRQAIIIMLLRLLCEREFSCSQSLAGRQIESASFLIHRRRGQVCLIFVLHGK